MDRKTIVIDLLTDYPQLQKDIVNKLHEHDIYTNTRELRSIFNSINKDYINGLIDFVVVSNKNGTYKSKEAEDIRAFNQKKINHAKSELWSAYNVNKRLSKRNDISLFEFIKECIDE